MKSRIAQLEQLSMGHTFDGDLISKDDRDELFKAGLVGRTCGWNFLTEEGVKYAVNLGMLSSNRKIKILVDIEKEKLLMNKKTKTEELQSMSEAAIKSLFPNDKKAYTAEDKDPIE